MASEKPSTVYELLEQSVAESNIAQNENPQQQEYLGGYPANPQQVYSSAAYPPQPNYYPQNQWNGMPLPSYGQYLPPQPSMYQPQPLQMVSPVSLFSAGMFGVPQVVNGAQVPYGWSPQAQVGVQGGDVQSDNVKVNVSVQENNELEGGENIILNEGNNEGVRAEGIRDKETVAGAPSSAFELLEQISKLQEKGQTEEIEDKLEEVRISEPLVKPETKEPPTPQKPKSWAELVKAPKSNTVSIQPLPSKNIAKFQAPKSAQVGAVKDGVKNNVNLARMIGLGYEVNLNSFDCHPRVAKFFVIKSYSEDDIHKSIKYGIWASTDGGNKRLDAGHRELAGRGPVYLFYSVNGSGQFCGLAEMSSSLDFSSSVDCWAQDKWRGQFTVKWIYIKDVPNREFRHIRLPNNENKPVTNSRDTQEIPYQQAIPMLTIFRDFKSKTSILDDFEFYDERQEDNYGNKH